MIRFIIAAAVAAGLGSAAVADDTAPVHGSGQAAHDHAAMPADDSGQITHIMKAQFDRPEAPLAVEPVAVSGHWAVAGWRQEGKGGRALLRKSDHGWLIHLCSGAALRDGMKLAEIGVPHADAMAIAAALGEAEPKLGADQVALLDSFEGTLMIEGGDHAGHDAHSAHGAHGQQN